MIVARNTILSIFFFWCKLFLWVFFWWFKVSGILWGVWQICNGSTESCLKAVEIFGGDIYKVMLHSWSSSSSDDAKFSRSCVKLQHICNHYWLIYWGVWIFAFSMAWHAAQCASLVFCHKPPFFHPLHFLSHTLKFLKTTNFACPLFPDAIFFFFVVLPLVFLSIFIKRCDKFSNSDVTGLTFRKLLLFPSRAWQQACGAILKQQVNKIQAGRNIEKKKTKQQVNKIQAGTKHREEENEAAGKQDSGRDKT